MTAVWCKECQETAILAHGKPETMNTEHGGQFACPLLLNVQLVMKFNLVRMGKEGQLIIFLSNGSGETSNMKISI